MPDLIIHRDAEVIAAALDAAGISGDDATITPLTVSAATGEACEDEQMVCEVWTPNDCVADQVARALAWI